MTITARPQRTAGGEDRHRQWLESVRSRGPVGPAEELGDTTHLLVELVGEPCQLFDADEYGSREYTELLGRIHEARSALEALQAHSVVALAAATRREEREAARVEAAQEADATPSGTRTDELADKRAGRDLSLITRSSPSAAGKSLGASRRLVQSMPNMFGALTAGKITADVAQKAASKARALDPDECRELDRVLGERLPDLDGAGTRRWGQEITAAIQSLDPQGAVARHQRARRERHVTLHPGEHGMATLSARLPALDAAQAHKRLSLEAERLRADGDRRGHQAIMADALSDTLIGRDEAMEPVTLDIGLIITDRALFSPDDGDVAHVEGYGAVPAEAVREQLRGALNEPATPDHDRYGPDGPALRAVLRRLYTHPTSGELVAVESTARAFPPALARFLRWRDLTCRGPFCNASIRQSDHVKRYAAGGRTSLDNGQGLCAHDNAKEEHFRSVKRLDQSTGSAQHVEWTSRNGVTRRTSPPPLTRPVPPVTAPSPAPTPPEPPAASPTLGSQHTDEPSDDSPPIVGPSDDSQHTDGPSDGSPHEPRSPDDGTPPSAHDPPQRE